MLNVVDTEAAREKLAKIKTGVPDLGLVGRRPHRPSGEDLQRALQQYRAARFNGDHLNLPGASSVFTLYPHQKRGIWRIVAAGSTYLAHAVGAGKTMTMAAAVMEQSGSG